MSNRWTHHVDVALADFDPETARLTALTALRAWTRQRDRMPDQRAALLATAWRAGERNVRELARIADVSRQTVYDDLRGQGIDPTNRTSAIDPPHHAPLTYEQVYDLAEHMRTVLLPSMIGAEPEPLAVAAWMSAKAFGMLAELLNPDSTDDRAATLDSIAHCADSIRRAAHQQWASEAEPVELARFTENAEITNAEVDIALASGGDTTMTVVLPDGMTTVQVTMSTAGHRDPDPDGWTRWTSNAPRPLAPINGLRHLEIQSHLAGLRELITHALHPALREEQ